MPERGLYHLTARVPTTTTAAVVGRFDADKDVEQAVLIQGAWINVFEPDEETGQLAQILRTHTFAEPRAIAKVKTHGTDLLAVTSDAGFLTILSLTGGEWARKISYAYGRSGVRAGVPGEYIAADPHGRAVLVAGVEGPKLCFTILTSNEDVSLGGPVLVPQTTRTFTYAVTALDMGPSANPVFAALEVEVRPSGMAFNPIAGAYTKFLAFYELNLGTMSCERLSITPVSFSACGLCAVPRVAHVNGGVVVFSDDTASYQGPDMTPVSVPLPRRSQAGQVEPIRVVSSCASPIGDDVLLLAQNQHGDIFKLALSFKERPKIEARFFQHVPPALELLLFKAGFLLACAESDDTVLYQLTGLEADPAVPISAAGLYTPSETNLLDPTHVLASLAPLTSVYKVENSVYYGCGSRNSGTLRSLEHGHKPQELGSTPLPLKPSAIFAAKDYLVLSFDSSTSVLLPGDEIKDCPDSGGLKPDVQTIWTGAAANGIVQATKSGMLYVESNNTDWWSSPADVVAGTGNKTHVCLALSDGTIAVFAAQRGKLRAWPERIKIDGSNSNSSLLVSLADTKPQLAVASENTLRIYNLEHLRAVRQAVRVLDDKISSVLLTKTRAGHALLVGTEQGRILQLHAADLAIWFSQLLGAQPVSLHSAVSGEVSAFALSSRTWALTQLKSGQLYCTPLLLETPLHSVVALPLLPSNSVSQSAFVGLAGSQMIVFAYNPDPPDFAHPTTEQAFPVGGLVKGLASTKAGLVLLTTDRTDGPRLEVLGRSEICCKLPDNSRALAMVSCTLTQGDTTVRCIVVSRAENYRFNGFSQLAPVACSACLLDVYCLQDDEFKLLHSTHVPQPVQSLLSVRNRLLAGIGGSIVSFRLGRTQLLRETVAKVPNFQSICFMKVRSNRLFAADSERSVALLAMDEKADGVHLRLAVMDVVPSSVTAMLVVDDDTVVTGDKFGNIVMLVCPAKLLNGFAYNELSSAVKPAQFERQAQFRTAESITALFWGPLKVGGQECICYTGIHGTIGVLTPVVDQTTFKQLWGLQTEQQQKRQQLLERAHDQFRGYYAPQKQVIDGDLCETAVDSEHARLVAEMRLRVCW